MSRKSSPKICSRTHLLDLLVDCTNQDATTTKEKRVATGPKSPAPKTKPKNHVLSDHGGTGKTRSETPAPVGEALAQKRGNEPKMDLAEWRPKSQREPPAITLCSEREKQNTSESFLACVGGARDRNLRSHRRKASGKRIDGRTGEKMSTDRQTNERKRQAFSGSRKIRERISPRRTQNGHRSRGQKNSKTREPGG
jgi:hypothetical protein